MIPGSSLSHDEIGLNTMYFSSIEKTDPPFPSGLITLIKCDTQVVMKYNYQ